MAVRPLTPCHGLGDFSLVGMRPPSSSIWHSAQRRRSVGKACCAAPRRDASGGALGWSCDGDWVRRAGIDGRIRRIRGRWKWKCCRGRGGWGLELRGYFRGFPGCIPHLLLGKVVGFGGAEESWSVVTLVVDSEGSKLGQGVRDVNLQKSTVLHLRRSQQLTDLFFRTNASMNNRRVALPGSCR